MFLKSQHKGTLCCSFFFFIFISFVTLHGQTTATLDANGPGDTYELINSIFGSGAASEVPDNFPTCNEVHVRHIREDWDSTLNKYVFLFDVYVDSLIDYDRCSNTDRQRIEIKTVSPSTITGQPGETHIYKWKFKMDSLFQPSPNFCHLHQIKATGGGDDGAPLITITPRKYSDPNQPEWLQLIFTPSTGGSGGGTLHQVELAPLKGQWLDVTQKVIYSDQGKYELTIKTLDGAVVMEYSNYFLDMYRASADFHRGKWGIYRSLNSIDYLRDETVAFSDFVIIEGEVNSVPSAPLNLNATSIYDKQINITWENNSATKTNFLIQKSLDGSSWGTAGVVNSYQSNYSVNGLEDSTTYYFRVRAENWNAYSDFSNILIVTTHGKEETDENLALNRNISFSSQQMEGGTGDNPASNAVDGDVNTRWSSARDSLWPQWIEVDLGSVKEINRTELICYSDRAYQFIVEVKADSNNTFTQVVDRSSNTTPGAVESPIIDEFEKVNARYVRLTVTGANEYAGPWSSIIEFRILNGSAAVNIKDTDGIPTEFKLNQNFPNPFNPTTKLNYILPKAGNVKLIIYDIKGSEVTTLINNYQQAGNYECTWEAKDAKGQQLASGVYFARMEAGSFVKSIKLMLLK